MLRPWTLWLATVVLIFLLGFVFWVQFGYERTIVVYEEVEEVNRASKSPSSCLCWGSGRGTGTTDSTLAHVSTMECNSDCGRSICIYYLSGAGIPAQAQRLIAGLPANLYLLYIPRPNRTFHCWVLTNSKSRVMFVYYQLNRVKAENKTSMLPARFRESGKVWADTGAGAEWTWEPQTESCQDGR